MKEGWRRREGGREGEGGGGGGGQRGRRERKRVRVARTRDGHSRVNRYTYVRKRRIAIGHESLVEENYSRARFRTEARLGEEERKPREASRVNRQVNRKHKARSHVTSLYANSAESGRFGSRNKASDTHNNRVAQQSR